MIFLLNPLFAQTSSNEKPRTEVQQAHDLKGKKGEFTQTKEGFFQAKIYSVKASETNKMHHWFLQIVDENHVFINNGSITMDAYHESDKSTKLNYMGPVFPMCQEGKYIIGFVNTDKGGKWILDITISHFEKKDSITLEMNVAE